MGSVTEPYLTPTLTGPSFQGLTLPDGSIPTKIVDLTGGAYILPTSEEMGTLNKLIQDYTPNADGGQQAA